MSRMDVPDRATADPVDRIDPTRLYDSLDDWRTAHAETVAAFEELESTQSPSATDDLRAFLDRVTACHERYARPGCDVTTRVPFERAANLIGDYVDRA